MRRSIWLGFDTREADAYAVAYNSIRRQLTVPLPIRGVILSAVKDAGLYTRETLVDTDEAGNRHLYDVISEHPMATEFAISRFLVPHLAQSGWALFMDCDVLVRDNLCRLFDLADPTKAVMVVKHHQKPIRGTKMRGAAQTAYPRKNWSSVVLWNVEHPANKRLTLDMINTLPGRDLHRFCWLDDDEIGELPPAYNYLVGESKGVREPVICHFTNGLPSMPGYDTVEYAAEWWQELERWAAT